MMWMLIMVIAMPQGVTSDILPFMDQAACRAAQADMSAKFQLLPLGRGGWVFMDCKPTATPGKKVPT